ncbi:MAG: hypothetical protein LBP35_00865 [Candidatus Ancillula trichonymphae]|jgi:recombinational DNA repair ATPase RecF|nr:hypothetical protein [Candidatus Ancillula trichonymphae]
MVGDPLPANIQLEIGSIGQIDEPEKQKQQLELPQENILITGAASAGKTNALEVIAMTRKLQNLEKNAINIHIINCSRANFNTKTTAVADIIDFTDKERIWRLLKDLPHNTARKCIIIDGIDIFREEYDTTGNWQIMQLLKCADEFKCV